MQWCFSSKEAQKKFPKSTIVGKEKNSVLVSSNATDGKSRITEMHVKKKKKKRCSEGETAGELQDWVCQWKENGDFYCLGATAGVFKWLQGKCSTLAKGAKEIEHEVESAV